METTYQKLLERELYAVEQRAQWQANWFMAVCVLVVYLITQFQVDAIPVHYRRYVTVMNFTVLAWFAINNLIIHLGYYHRSLKYVNVMFQVSMVSMFLMISARIMGVEFALSSFAPMLYVVVIAVSSLTLNPFLCLLAGGFAAGQFFGMYAFWLHDKVSLKLVDTYLFGWSAILIRSIIFLLMGVAAMYMARRARSLLETVVAQVSSTEKLRFMEQDMEQAAVVQRNLVPQVKPDCPDLDIEIYYQPSQNVGGDYIDFIRCANGLYWFVVGDVSGKGLAAALLMSNIQAMVKLLSQQDCKIRDLVRILNASVCQSNAHGRFVSFISIEVDIKNKELRYINCGHNPPYIFRKDQSLVNLGADYPVLGINQDEQYKETSVSFGENDVLFAYTDGLSELKHQDGSRFGTGRIEYILQEINSQGPVVIRQTMLQRLAEYSQTDDFRRVRANDDLSFLCVKPKMGFYDRRE